MRSSMPSIRLSMLLRAGLGLLLATPNAGLAGPGTPPAARDPLEASALMQHVRTLTDERWGGRDAGSPGEALAIDYVFRRLTQAGLAPRLQRVKQLGRHSANVYALIPGQRPRQVVVVGAHLDHLGGGAGEIYPGAEDNASGVAVLLGLADALARRRRSLNRSVLIVFFTGEERNLLGSRAFVSDPPVPVSEMAAMVNLDMLGRPLAHQLLLAPLKRPLGIDDRAAVGLVGTHGRPALRRLIDEACARAGVSVVAAEDLPDAIEREV
jgi:hypothetical protein